MLLLLPGFLFSMEHPVNVKLVKKQGNNYTLKVSVPDGFGIQREAPNRLLVSGEGIKVTKADLKFKGPVNSKKNEYFLAVDEMPLVLEGKGILQIQARIYYCDYSKNICINGKMQFKEKVD